MNVIGSERGQGVVEYALIFALVAAVVIGALLLLGPGVGKVFSEVSEGIESTPPAQITEESVVVTDTVPTQEILPTVELTPEERATRVKPTPWRHKGWEWGEIQRESQGQSSK